jgi:hypothetical protein
MPSIRPHLSRLGERLCLDRLAKRRVLNATGCSGNRSLREHIATTTGPTRLLGLIASLPIRLYQLLRSYRRELCGFPRGRNCSAIALSSLRLYGVITGAAVMYRLLLAPGSVGRENSGDDDDPCADC